MQSHSASLSGTEHRGGDTPSSVEAGSAPCTLTVYPRIVQAGPPAVITWIRDLAPNATLDQNDAGAVRGVGLISPVPIAPTRHPSGGVSALRVRPDFSGARIGVAIARGIDQLRGSGRLRPPLLLLTDLLERQARGLRNDIEHRVRRSARQCQTMQSFPRANSHRGTIEFGRLLDPLALRALRLLVLFANNPRGIARRRLAMISRG